MADITDPSQDSDDDEARRQALLDRLAASRATTPADQTSTDSPSAGDKPNSADNPGPSDTRAATDDGPSSLGTGAAPDKFSAVQNVLADRTGVSPAADQPLRTRPINDDTDRLPVASAPTPSIPTPTPPRPAAPIDEASLRIAAGLGAGGSAPATPALQTLQSPDAQARNAPIPAPPAATPTPTDQSAARVAAGLGGGGIAPTTPTPAPPTPTRPVNDVAPTDIGKTPAPSLGDQRFPGSPGTPSNPLLTPEQTKTSLGDQTLPGAPGSPINPLLTPQQTQASLGDQTQPPAATPPVSTALPTRPVQDVAPGPAAPAQGSQTVPAPKTTPDVTTAPTQSDVIKTILGGTPATSKPAGVTIPTPNEVAAVAKPSTGTVAPIVNTVNTAKTPFQVAQQIAAGNAPASTGVQSQAASGIGAASSAIQSIQAELAKSGNTPEAAQVFTQQLQGILAMINQQEAQLRADAAKNGSTIDTATQTALDQLKKSLNDSLRATQEDLNRRGLYQSGILLDLEQKLRTGNMTAEASLLGKRLDEIEKNLQANLQNLSKERFTTMRDFGMKGAEAQFTAGQNDQNRRERLITEMARLQGEQERQQNQFAFQQAEQARLFAHEDHSAAERRAFDAQQAQQKQQFDLLLERQRTDAAAALKDKELASAKALQDQRIAAGEFSRGAGRGGGNSGGRGDTGVTIGGTGVDNAVRAYQADVMKHAEQGYDPVAGVVNNRQALIDAVGPEGYDAILQTAQSAHNQATQR